MSRLHLLTHSAIGATRSFAACQRQNCVKARTDVAAAAPICQWFQGNNHTNYSNYLIARNNSSYNIGGRRLPYQNGKDNVWQNNDMCIIPFRCLGTKSTPDLAGKSESKSSAVVAENDLLGETSNLGLFAKFKLMYKKYWYVLLPVHVVTSIGWFGGFYYMSKSGVDVADLLQYMHLSETIIEKVKHSDMGHYAIAYLCYKVATPLRYAVTVGGTTVSIKYLVQTGYIKPMPSKQQIINMYAQKKADRAAAKADKEKP